MTEALKLISPDLMFLIAGFIFGEGLRKFISFFRDGKRIKQELDIQGKKAPVELDGLGIQNMQIVVDNLVREVTALRKDRDKWVEMYHELKEEADEISKELNTVTIRMNDLQSRLESSQPTP